MQSTYRKSIESEMVAHSLAIHRLGGTEPLTVVEVPLANATSTWFCLKRSRPLTQASAMGGLRTCPGRSKSPDQARDGASARPTPSEKERANRRSARNSTPNGLCFEGQARGKGGAASGNVVEP